VGRDSLQPTFENGAVSSPVQSTTRTRGESTVDVSVPTIHDCEATSDQNAYTLQSRVESVEVVTNPHESEESSVASSTPQEEAKDEDFSGCDATMSSTEDSDDLEQHHASSTDYGSRKVDGVEQKDEARKGQRLRSKRRTPSTPSADSFEDFITGKDVNKEPKGQEEQKESRKLPGKGRRRKRRKRTFTKPTKEKMLPDFSFDSSSSVEIPDEQSGKVLSTAENSKRDDPRPNGSDTCKADEQHKGEQDTTLETSQREAHPPMLPSKLSGHKEKDTTVSPSWTTDDDNALLLARRRHPDLTWAQIPALLPGNRSLSALVTAAMVIC